MGNHRQNRRSELFLVRVWMVEVNTESAEVAWHGKVQRITDGEVHQWHSWQELMDWLLAMLSKQEGKEPR